MYNLARQEPNGWPLKRPITQVEWRQVIKAMVIRRVPETRSIDRVALHSFVNQDVTATLESGRLYLDSGLYPTNHGGTVIGELIKHGLLREGIVGYRLDFPSIAVMNIFRTEYTEEYLSLLPRHIAAVLDYFPVTNELDLLAGLISDPEQDLPTILPTSPAYPSISDLSVDDS
jgi:hypothetical protein